MNAVLTTVIGVQGAPVETENQERGESPERLGAKRILLLLTLVAKILVVASQALRPCVAQETCHLDGGSNINII